MTQPTGVVEIPNGRSQAEPHRRTRVAAEVDPKIRGWLQRMARTHAHITCVVRLFGAPERAGGQSLHGETYADRAARGDRTLLHDCCLFIVDEMNELRREIMAEMDAAPPCPHPPGSRAKVDEMERRAHGGYSLFIPGDADTSLE
jgi:hypothetical protein